MMWTLEHATEVKTNAAAAALRMATVGKRRWGGDGPYGDGKRQSPGAWGPWGGGSYGGGGGQDRGGRWGGERRGEQGKGDDRWGGNERGGAGKGGSGNRAPAASSLMRATASSGAKASRRVSML